MTLATRRRLRHKRSNCKLQHQDDKLQYQRHSISRGKKTDKVFIKDVSPVELDIGGSSSVTLATRGRLRHKRSNCKHKHQDHKLQYQRHSISRGKKTDKVFIKDVSPVELDIGGSSSVTLATRRRLRHKRSNCKHKHQDHKLQHERHSVAWLVVEGLQVLRVKSEGFRVPDGSMVLEALMTWIVHKA